MVLKEPVKAPPPQQRQWWSAGETQLNSLSLIFSLLIFSAEEWGVRRSSSSQAFLLLLTQICLFSPLCICVLSHRKHSFLFDHLPESYRRTPVLGPDEVTPVLERILRDLGLRKIEMMAQEWCTTMKTSCLLLWHTRGWKRGRTRFREAFLPLCVMSLNETLWHYGRGGVNVWVTSNSFYMWVMLH